MDVECSRIVSFSLRGNKNYHQVHTLNYDKGISLRGNHLTYFMPLTEKNVEFRRTQFNKYSDAQLRDKVRYIIQPSEKSEGTVFLLLFYYKEPQMIWDTHKSML